MSSINSVVVSGNLGADPEARYFESGKVLVEFPLAVSGYSKGEKTTDWVECKVWGRPDNDSTAMAIINYCKKGSKIGLTGRLKQEKWQAKDTGVNRSKLIVVGSQVELLDSKQSGETHEQRQQPQSSGGGAPDYDQIPFNRFEDYLHMGA